MSSVRFVRASALGALLVAAPMALAQTAPLTLDEAIRLAEARSAKLAAHACAPQILDRPGGRRIRTESVRGYGTRIRCGY